MRHPKLTSRTVIAGVLVLAVAVGTGWYLLGHRHRPQSAADRTAISSAREFLDDWSEPDGRVVRRDQGGDTVSEGQAYGLLLALVAHDRSRFDSIWKWTKMHMQQADGLLAWRWSDGHLADEQSAADADVDTAWALSRAAVTFGTGSYANDSKHIADAILTQETVPSPQGPVLVAGPWATSMPVTVNPSYLVGGTATLLAASTGDSSWNQVADATRVLDHSLVQSTALPPDWASLSTDAGSEAVTATGSPDHSAGPRYGLDAPRLLIRLAASCAPADRTIAATAAPIIGDTTEPGVRALSGDHQVDWQHPITDVALAAVRSATGDGAGVTSALAAADQLQTAYPSYYGAAWVALGQAMLSTDLLGSCARTAA